MANKNEGNEGQELLLGHQTVQTYVTVFLTLLANFQEKLLEDYSLAECPHCHEDLSKYYPLTKGRQK